MEAARTLGDFLGEDDPVGALWPSLVDLVYRDSPCEAHPDRLTPEARTLYFVCMFNGEVANGGISQFFSNSAGNYTHETQEALDRIGARLSARLLEQAMTLFPGKVVPSDRQERCRILFTFEELNTELLSELTDIYYRDVESLGGVPQEDVDMLLIDFLRKHATARLLADV